MAIVFDLDGTLIDSAPDIARAAEQALADYGLTIDAAAARRWLGDGAAKLIERALASIDVTLSDGELEALTARFSAIYEAEPVGDTRLFDGLLSVLDALKARGVRLAICTNKPQAIAERVVDALGLSSRFDQLVGGGDYPLKPAPDAVSACLDSLQAAPHNSVYVGDMGVDLAAGHAAGLPVLLARFGYAGNAVESLGADGVFDSWGEFEQALAALK